MSYFAPGGSEFICTVTVLLVKRVAHPDPNRRPVTTKDTTIPLAAFTIFPRNTGLEFLATYTKKSRRPKPPKARDCAKTTFC